MNLQVLLATMNQKNYKILKKMNINSDAIIINQTSENKFEEFEYYGNHIKWYSINERGVGLSRNTSLTRASADICLFADDDVEYTENYKDIIIEEFKQNKNADIIIFNVSSTNKNRSKKLITKNKRLRFYNVFKYGTFQIAIRLSSIQSKNIHFSLLFGGGAKYSAGEDSLFLKESLDKGLKIYSSPQKIGEVSHEESTWFKGYSDKYFFDTGVLYKHLFNKYSKMFALQYVIRKRKDFKEEKTWFEAYKLMLKGINDKNY